MRVRHAGEGLLLPLPGAPSCAADSSAFYLNRGFEPQSTASVYVVGPRERGGGAPSSASATCPVLRTATTTATAACPVPCTAAAAAATAGKAIGLTFGCLVAGAILGSALQSWLRVDIVPLGVRRGGAGGGAGRGVAGQVAVHAWVVVLGWLEGGVSWAQCSAAGPGPVGRTVVVVCALSPSVPNFRPLPSGCHADLCCLSEPEGRCAAAACCAAAPCPPRRALGRPASL